MVRIYIIQIAIILNLLSISCNKELDGNEYEVEKLKKVEQILNKEKLTELVDNLNHAYKSHSGIKIDEATKEIFDFFESYEASPFNGIYFQLRNYTWQKNHLLIVATINNLLISNSKMPTTTELAEKSGLSEETIYKHLKQLKNNEFYKDENEKYSIMVHRILTSLYNLGINGNVKAC